MTNYARYNCLDRAKELERSRHVDDSLVWPARERVLEALNDHRNAEKWTDVAYYLDEHGNHLGGSIDHVKCNWVGLAGISLYLPSCTVKSAIRCVWHDLDIPHMLVEDYYSISFPLVAEKLYNLFLRLDARLNVE